MQYNCSLIVDLKIENKLKEKNNLNAILKKQTHKIEEKYNLLEHIEDVKQAIQRQNEMHEAQLDGISKYDSNFIEMKNKVY